MSTDLSYLTPPPVSPEMSPLPHGWEAKQDPSSGKFFFVDHINRKSTWVRPVAVDYDQPPPRPPPPPPPLTDLPPGYEEKIDQETGDKYYVDHMNRESSWDRPTKAAQLKGLVSTKTASISSKHSGDPISPGSNTSRTESITLHNEEADVFVSPQPVWSAKQPNCTEMSVLTEPTIVPIPSPNGLIQATSRDSSGGHGPSDAQSVTSSFTSAKVKTIGGVSLFPAGPPKPITEDLECWLLQEGPKQKGLKPKGIDAMKQAWSKRKQDSDLAPENVDIRNVSINGHLLSLPQIRWFSVQYNIRFRNDTHYWYDRTAGFIGKLGGPLKWVVTGRLNIHGDLHGRSSLGDTKITINKRELDAAEVENWAQLKMQLVPHTDYVVDPEGYVARVGDDQPLYNWREKEEMAKVQIKGKEVMAKKLGEKIVRYGVKLGLSLLAGEIVDL